MTRSIKLVFASMLFGQVVVAQPAPTAPDNPPTAPAAGTDVGLGGVRQRPTLSPQEMVAQAREYRGRLDQIQKTVQALADQARKQRDVIRLNCLVDKLAQLKANTGIADDAVRALDEAAAKRDEGAAMHEYTRVTIVHQKAQVLGSEAQACIGEDLTYVGATRVDVEVEGVPPDDFTQPGPNRPVVDRPPSASPMM